MTEPMNPTDKVNSEEPSSTTGFEFSQPASATKSIERRTTVRRKFIPIQPLKFTPGGFKFQEPSNQLMENSSIKCQTRKTLFKISTDPLTKANTGSTTGFVRDENGKFCMVPLNLPELSQPASVTKSSEKKNTVRRKFIPIQPLKFTPADFEKSPNQVTKKPRMECQSRKELFKVPQKKAEKRFSKYGNRRSQINKTKFNSTKKVTNLMGTPLIDVDEADELLNQHRRHPQLTKTILFPLNSKKNMNNTPKKTPLSRIDETVTNNDSMKEDLEFLQLEKALASAKKAGNNFCSPMTSVCTLLENTKLTSSSRKTKDKNGILNKILTMVKEDREQFDALKQHFAKYQDEHETRLKAITKLIEENFDDKENSNTKRRSLRIASKNKFIISPAISQKVDLRKSALNRNLSMNLQYESPRTKNAINMYNTFRSDCSVLCTPKLDRTNAALPQDSATRSLSRRIQKQCLLLQDTPRPKSLS